MPSKKIAIIGIGGVGKEHIRAARNLGLEIIGVDNNLEVLREYENVFFPTKTIVNKWGKVEEKFEIEPFKLYTDLFFVPEYDYAVIATPTFTHQVILDSIFNDKPVLIEKPMNIDWNLLSCNIPSRVFGGYTYACLDLKKKPVKEHTFVLTVDDHYNSQTWRADSTPAEDLIPHLLALGAVYFKQDSIKLLSIQKFKNSAMLEVLYGETDKAILIGIYGKDGHNLTINGKGIPINYEELFTKQLKKFISGEKQTYLQNIENFYATHLKSTRV
jgi:hypothetical protein